MFTNRPLYLRQTSREHDIGNIITDIKHFTRHVDEFTAAFTDDVFGLTLA